MPQTIRTPIAALVFDAYGTLFDVYAIGALAERLAPGHGADLARLWRTKQLEYTWLQSLMAGGTAGRRENFDRITAHALDFAVTALALPFGSAQKQELRDAYLTLTAFPDARAALAALAPRPRWILSNGTLGGINALVRNNAMETLIDGVLSVDAVDIYKPAPQVYALAAGRLRPAAGTHRLRVVELLGRDRRPRVRIHDVLDQPCRRTARSSRSAAAARSCLAGGAARALV